MATTTEKIAFTEVLNILNFIEKEFYNKIPTEIINIFEKNKIDYYQYYDEKGKLKVSNLTEQILCYLNLEYWCKEEEKKELIKKYVQNDELLTKKYDINTILEKRKNKNTKTITSTTDEKSMIVYKENWIIRLFNKIFKRK